ncbi:BRCT-containing protein 1 [Cytospora mali]|uniref:BRCT-containing protein 1 n=1 Tax=Cytospora mali TaxID=578113 RepID=A0A194W1H2_CYTMA|nr:BRCT-containing protein 1 [Valsa mali]
MASRTSALFDECAFAFVPSKNLTDNTIDLLKDTVKKYGAEVIERDEDGSFPVSECTHIVADMIDFPEYDEAMAMMVPVVIPEWVNASLHKNRQAQIRPYSPDPRLIFSNVVLTCDDIPITDKETIAGAVLAMGGMETKDLGRLVTHICALSMDGPKVQLAQQKGFKCKVVLPHWFDDCFRLGKRIDEGPYLLPDPEILNANPDDAVAIPSSQHLEGAASARPDRPPMTAHFQQGAREKLTVFQDKNIMLSRDLGINDQLKKTLKRLIQDGGGQVVDKEEACDWFVCQYRDGPDYTRAAQQGKDVGNLAWLYYLIVHNRWTNPFRRLLHYPVPRGGIPGFQGLRITLSNYGGEARMYLQNLLKAAGAEPTGSMKQDNTHLITARKSGEKCEAAADWNIPMVNHLWVEESYAKCEAQAITDPRYTHFPPRTNLGEIIGQTSFDESKLRAKYYPGGDDDLDTAAYRKRKIQVLAKENGYTHGPAAGVVIGRQKHPEFDIIRDDEAEYASKTTKKFGVPAPPRPKAKQQAAATPIRDRRVLSGKENDASSVYSSGSRSAKASALSKLQDLASDIALYEKERKRKSTGNTPFGGKRAANLIEQEQEKEREKKAQGKARSHSPNHDQPEDEEEEEEEEEKRPAKRQKPTLPPVDMRIILTGYKGWINNIKKEDADKRKLRSMGIQIVQENAPCDYLAAPQMVRTIKFLRVLARGPDVINSSFIDACLEAGERVEVDDYKLKDKASEAKFGIKLEKAISRARANKGRLLWGVAVYCTKDIKSGADSYKPIAEANGAIFKTYTGRGASTIKPTKPDEDSQGPEPVYLLTSNSKAEKDLWPRFEKMARDGNMVPRVVASDWLLHVAMSQELKFDKRFLATNYFKGR